MRAVGGCPPGRSGTFPVAPPPASARAFPGDPPRPEVGAAQAPVESLLSP